MTLALLLSAAAALGNSPQMIDSKLWVSDADYPSAAINLGRGGAVVFNLTVGPSGKPTGCTVTRSSGYKPLDIRTCAVSMNRARFRPARDEAGDPITSVLSRRVTWSPDAPLTMDIPVDLVVNVQRLPGEVRDPAIVVRQVLTYDGKVESCQVDRPGRLPALEKLACAQAADLAKLGPAKGDSGLPVKTMRVLEIMFTDS